MKTFTIIKVGYSRGNVGCTNEFFTCIYTSKEGFSSLHFKGMYGAEERVSRLMRAKGFKDSYIQSRFGQLKGEDRRHAEKWSLNEGQAEDFLKGGLKDYASFLPYPKR